MSSKLLVIALAAFLLFGAMKMMGSKSESSTLLSSEEGVAQPILESFREWKRQYNKRYGSVETEQYRFQIFYENTLLIEQHNSQNEVTFTLGANQFMDLSHEEWAEIYLINLSKRQREQPSTDFNTANAAFNWATKGAVTPVKNQASCGSCWAFSATGVVEGYWKINKGSLPNLSEQQLVDCSGSYGNMGCNGGWPASALEYVRDHGIVTSQEYPYTARDGTCKVNSGPYKIPSVLESKTCATLTKDITSQPTSVAVDATNWQFYKNGIFSNCGKSVNHGVLATGWDNNNNWIVKNSWGTTWGDKGYITLKNGDTCAVCDYMANAPN